MSERTISEIFANPETDPIPSGIRMGDLVQGLRIDGKDPASGDIPDSLEAQIAGAFENMRRAITNAGGGLGNIAQVSIFFEDGPTGMTLLNAAWEEAFPDADDRPTYKFITTPLVGGRQVQFEFFGVLNASRQVIELPVVAHTNPIPMGVRIGDYLFTSRVLPFSPETGKPGEDAASQADFVFHNVGATLEAGGMGWDAVRQGRLFLSDMGGLPSLRERWSSQFGGEARPLHPIHYAVAPSLLVMLEVIAAV
ncbi:MAG: RidA family protein [Rhodospirillaceae bacterium]|nr:RidA family protein [Rhodospirillaceae bacterium]MBT4114992.1 RidA family protein [Rhodospirillaceae bacterium]MBT4671416.1 RidA family protein [Rhodospirillaceae bacterium]MBT4721442.1 RidA family protein [Rhodospirillaceae bacterium]MBT4750582.1 RidA family protein [Rhodospirillaceae bacterium]